MTVYMVAQVQILDPEQWERYKEIASREIARHGGRYLTRGARPEVEEAGWNQPEDLQINIAAFPSLRQAHAWYNSPEYAKALAFRQVAVRNGVALSAPRAPRCDIHHNMHYVSPGQRAMGFCRYCKGKTIGRNAPAPFFVNGT